MTEREIPQEVFTTLEAAHYLRCSTQYLEISRCKGGGPPFTRVGPRLIRYRKSALDAWLLEREVVNQKEASGAHT